ncbi:MAG: TRAM domain-containing protein [Armatimonadetes bacterium]|nr:TRAM domain-containing protein [Armatimonadota bacterium]
MSVRSFEQWFGALVLLCMTAMGITAGSVVRWPAYGSLPSFDQLCQTYPVYRSFTVAAFGIIGIVSGAVLGPKLGAALVRLGNAIDQMSARDKVAAVVGVLLGLLVTAPVMLLLHGISRFGVLISLVLGVAFVYLGVRYALGMGDQLSALFFPHARPEHGALPAVAPTSCKILDTNVIIDGRIVDVCRAGFIEGTLYVAGFVLDELQHIADAADPQRRARGRRGLDMLAELQADYPLLVRTLDHFLPDRAPREVDGRLVVLAKRLNGTIVTNDFNLNKVASLQGVSVMNINELANALKAVMLPGEEMRVSVIREGKEPNQGVAYLDDGTMIVIDDGRKHIGADVEVTVTSALQTSAGKMVFARLKPRLERARDAE